MKAEIKRWLKKAKKDFGIAFFNFGGEKLDAAAFYCQQATEKALKSLFIKKFGRLIKTHDLKLLSSKLNAPKEIHERCAQLSRAYSLS